MLTCLSKATATQAVTPGAADGLGFRALVVSDLPASIDYKEMRVTPSKVEATERQGQIVILGDCGELYGLLRGSADGHVAPVDASNIPKG